MTRTGTTWTSAWIATGLTGALLLTGCTSARPTPSDPDTPSGGLRLVAFDSCDDLLEGLRTAAKATVGPYGLVEPQIMTAEDGGRTAVGADKAAAPAAAPGAPPPGTGGHSTTNAHERGVDEPDLVKTDGRRIVSVEGGVLHVVDVATRRVTGSLRLADAHTAGRAGAGEAQLLLAGDRALVLVPGGYAGPVVGGPETGDPGRGGPDGVDPGTGPAGPDPVGPVLLAVELSGAPRVTGRYTIDGQLVDARQVGATVRVVVRSSPRMAFPYDGSAMDDDARIAANQKIIDAAPLADWLPRYGVDDAHGHRTGAVDCTAVSRPARYTGAAMLTLLTFDLAKGGPGRVDLGDGEPVSVVADGDTVYSNGPSLYVTNHAVRDTPRAPARAAATELYRFDTSGPGRPRFAAAGSVPGYLLNQYSLSEWDGHLRVATTSAAPWRSGRTDRSESAVYVLRQEGATLARTGHVGGLGKGERIYAVRFLGGTGYVVTFRQTDPLYALDLRDPAAPRVLGELKINGYSAYLHPVGDGRLLGVGQEATSQGQVQGTQVSLFDVSDLARPARLDQYHVRWGSSEAEFQPHAFLYWPATRLLVVPLSAPQTAGAAPDPGYRPAAATQGALALRVDDRGLAELGVVTHPVSGRYPYGVAIRRSLVIDDTLWTLSEAGLAANDTRSLADVAWLPFP